VVGYGRVLVSWISATVLTEDGEVPLRTLPGADLVRAALVVDEDGRPEYTAFPHLRGDREAFEVPGRCTAMPTRSGGRWVPTFCANWAQYVCPPTSTFAVPPRGADLRQTNAALARFARSHLRILESYGRHGDYKIPRSTIRADADPAKCAIRPASGSST
jgi:hypothetical protein